MKKSRFIFLGIAFILLAFTSCENKGDLPDKGKGRLSVYVTDDPFPIDLFSKTIVSIDKIEVRKHDSLIGEEDPDSFAIINDTPLEIDLLELTNGITELVGSVDLDPGYYDRMRLHVVSAVIILKDGREFDLKIPSGSSSGLKVKIQPPIHIADGVTSDVLLDFDLSKSFVLRGNLNNINGFIFKPVVRGVFLGQAGRITGIVSDTTGVAIENAMVKLWPPEYLQNEPEENDDEDFISSTFTDETGKYKFIGIPGGDYALTTQKEGYRLDSVYAVTVVAGNETELNIQLQKLE